MKKKIMKAGILIVVFCAAVIISSLVINKDVSDEAADTNPCNQGPDLLK